MIYEILDIAYYAVLAVFLWQAILVPYFSVWYYWKQGIPCSGPVFPILANAYNLLDILKN
jgi:hypothetical protein